MIEINLLPHELRKKPSILSVFSKIDLSWLDAKKIPVLPIASGVIALLVVLQIALFSIGIIFGVQLSAATKKYSSISAAKKEADALKTQVAEINRMSSAIDELMFKRFSWAKKLNTLSDSLTPGIWLSQLDYDEKPSPLTGKGKRAIPGALVISGYASGSGEQGTVLIGKLIKSLEENRDFYADFENIDLVSTKSDKVDNQDVMSFKITCNFK